jgi:hypothetical protein
VREKDFDDRKVRRQADREFSKHETEMAKQREAYAKYSHFLGCLLVLSDLQNRKEGRRGCLAVKVGASAARILIPGTPRPVGVGAGLGQWPHLEKNLMYRSGRWNSCVPVFYLSLRIAQFRRNDLVAGLSYRTGPTDVLLGQLYAQMRVEEGTSPKAQD